jgi:hypothetical protein
MTAGRGKDRKLIGGACNAKKNDLVMTSENLGPLYNRALL